MSNKVKFTRRDFLKLGGATLVVAAGGSVWRAIDQGMFSAGEGPAYEAWKNWRDAVAPFERIVAAGILASNPHNSSPGCSAFRRQALTCLPTPAARLGWLTRSAVRCSLAWGAPWKI